MFDWQNQLVEIRFPAGEDNFLKVKETLTRIGAPAYGKDEEERVLWQSCHILHKRQKYMIVHFKEMFLLDGKENQTSLTDNDLARRNAIALLLEQWGLIELVRPDQVRNPAPAPIESLKILPFKEKSTWALRTKYDIGNKGKADDGIPKNRMYA